MTTSGEPPVSLIWAMAENRVIGIDNRLPWRLPADLKRFRTLTSGHHILMGRKTFESFPKPLPNRVHVVITRDRDYRPRHECIVAHSIDEALQIARQDSEIFIIGGASLYAQTVARADRLYLTLIHAQIAGDTKFPEIEWNDWEEVGRQDAAADETNPYAYSFVDWVRAKRAHPA